MAVACLKGWEGGRKFSELESTCKKAIPAPENSRKLPNTNKTMIGLVVDMLAK